MAKKNENKINMYDFMGNSYHLVLNCQNWKVCIPISSMDFVCEHNVAKDKACFSCYWKLPPTIEKPVSTKHQSQAEKSEVEIPMASRDEQIKKPQTENPDRSKLVSAGCQMKRLSESAQEILKIVKKRRIVKHVHTRKSSK